MTKSLQATLPPSQFELSQELMMMQIITNIEQQQKTQQGINLSPLRQLKDLLFEK